MAPTVSVMTDTTEGLKLKRKALLVSSVLLLYMYFNFPCYYEPPRVHMPYFENPGLNERGAKTGRFKQEELRGCSEAQCKINKDYSEQ